MTPTLRVLVSGVLLCAALPAQRGADLVATDARMAGRGGSDVAIAEDLSGLLSNPAGLVNITQEWRIDMTARAFLLGVDYEDPFNTGGVESEELAVAPYISVSWDPDPGDAGRPGDVRFGLGLQHIAGFRSDLDLGTQDFPPPLQTRRRVEYLYTGVHLGAGWQLSEDVSVGATLSLTYSDLEVMEPLQLDIFQVQGMSPLGIPWGQLLNNMFGIESLRIEGLFDSKPTFGASATLGFQWKPSDVFSLGFAYRTPGFQEDYEGDVSVDISRIFGEPDPVTFPDGFAVDYDGKIVDFDYPQMFSIGAAWKPSEEVRLSCELRWTNWSATHDKIRIQLRNGNNPGFNAFIGANRLDVTQDWGWRDQIAAMVGVEWAFADGWVLRAGGGAWNSPVEKSAAIPNAPAFSEYMATLGIGYSASGWSLDLAWIHVFESTVRVDESTISTNLDGSRQSVAVDSVLVSFSIWF